jgi:hypothetical protein
MDKSLTGICGAYCGYCEWKDRMNCPGCPACHGNPFWGECAIARCAMDRDFTHCGECPALPCAALKAAFDHPEYGDRGERLCNLKHWAQGVDTCLRLRALPKK